jgi:hypothetical protein
MKKINYEILTGSTTGVTYQLPIFLESSVDEMGIMVGFDGDIEQIEQFCNFTYTGFGNVITIYNTLNTNKLKTLIDCIFTISWGDDASETLDMPTVYDSNLPYASHFYSTGGTYNVEISVDSPWDVQKIKRGIIIPFSGATFPSNFGILTFTIPYSNPPITGVTQAYLEDYRTLTGNTNDTTISFLALGKSRIDEFRLYGTNLIYSGTTTGHTDAGDYTGYTIDGLFYMDYADGYTHITGSTSDFSHEELYNGMITRNEHLIGFLDDPVIYSDIFIERGKQSVMERNLRLGEIGSTGELELYGSGFFKVKK